MSKVSIIIPVYNTEKFLCECMESVLNQSLYDIEIICVDDGSTDSSGAILDKYAEKDGRIKVIHKRNSGYGDSVNTGIEHSSGEYVGIVEPDDYIALDMYERLYGRAKEKNLDVVKGNFVEFSGIHGHRSYTSKKIIENKSCYGRVIKPLSGQEIFYGYIINPSGIYSRKFLDRYEIRHNTTPGASYQDVGFWFQVMVYSDRMELIDADFYYYRRDNSASSMNSRSKVFCICDEYEFLIRKLSKHGRTDPSIWACLTMCMYAGYHNTLFRIAVEFRKDFIKKFSQDFRELRDKKLFVVDALSEEEQRNLSRIMEHPEEYIEEATAIARTLHEKLAEYENAMIYGAGIYGRKVLKNLYQEDLKKIRGFAVTQLAGQPDNIENYQVEELECYLDQKEEIAVVIGVSSRYKDEVYRNLKKYGFIHIIDSGL